MNVAIIGAGLIGAKRAGAVVKNSDLKLVCDLDSKRAEELAKKYDADFCTHYNEVVNHNGIDTVIVATTNKFLTSISVASLNAAKYVLCEKPLGRNSSESRQIADSAKAAEKIVKTGFNHRFHPAIMKAKQLVDFGEIGSIINIRARYGHGGRPGYENEWRCDKDISGGGELVDQGVHLIDLCRWFSGNVKEVYGKTLTTYWPIAVEDNAFFLLNHKNDVISQCHVSWTNWKNIFSFEIFGTDGFIHIAGLGGHYGVETLSVGVRNADGGAPTIKKESFPGPDESWRLEWENFAHAIRDGVVPNGSLEDGVEANRVVDAIYESSRLNKSVFLT